MKKSLRSVSQKRFKKIAWEVGKQYPILLAGDHIALLMVNPRLGNVHWQIRKDSVEVLEGRNQKGLSGARMVVRIYDVTDILFDGFNAHAHFDSEVFGLSGNSYFSMGRLGRNYLAEIGFRFEDGSFHCLARSNTVFFDRDRPSGDCQIKGLFVGGALNRTFLVENIFDAPVYEKMNRELSSTNREGPLSVAVVFLRVEDMAGSDSPLGSFIKNSSQILKKFGAHVRLFAPQRNQMRAVKNQSLIRNIDALSRKIHTQLVASHKKMPFHVIHCHDWCSSAAGLSAAKKLNLPMILTLHSTEHERAQGRELNCLSSVICRREKKGVQGADLVVVPHASTRQQVITLYGGPPERVVILPDVFDALTGDSHYNSYSNPSEVRRWFGLDENGPVVLFAGEMSHAAGADLLIDALPTVCRNHSEAQFVFAGEGPLKAELEGRTWHAGIGHRCRFVGDVSKEKFEVLLAASDFVVIPARTWQNEGLARMATGCGKPVLTTHQAGLNCIVHGENGLVTFDNPGSIVWGIQELLCNPLKGSMLRLVARKRANETPSIENVVVQHYLYYEDVVKNFDFPGADNA